MCGPRRLLLLPLLLSLVVACAGSPPEPDPVWAETEIVEVPSDGVLWKVALYSCQKMGFPLATGLDPSTMEMTTGWRNDLQPFSGEGHRTQAQLKMKPLGRGTWQIEARVKKQLNQSLARPLDLRYAEWEWTGDDVDTARILVHHIRAYLDPTIEARDRPADEIEALLRRAGLEDDGNER